MVNKKAVPAKEPPESHADPLLTLQGRTSTLP